MSPCTLKQIDIDPIDIDRQKSNPEIEAKEFDVLQTINIFKIHNSGI